MVVLNSEIARALLERAQLLGTINATIPKSQGGCTGKAKQGCCIIGSWNIQRLDNVLFIYNPAFVLPRTASWSGRIP